ncbi:hypothetical protein X773_26890 [Mesorhizobium sp. LSJC285A00]|nr:hypothetical protein X773_26890 [Mesorhizobium sp. LSJC285A00]ESW84003.1 hypothetical protein X770_25765 [Mesorhizobium sp. LSJC269B00]ESX25110.1 hypothetical protein X767_10500 [Mesorhizobium sp. LSJC264A00]ESY99165.1 hypothetical protein X736_33520 [Mesorhizobium sp. L2C089B000]ESZ25385.1 hypothetical protein X733_31040 [Mesorhizobium sp. L2C067A000]
MAFIRETGCARRPDQVRTIATRIDLAFAEQEAVVRSG